MSGGSAVWYTPEETATRHKEFEERAGRIFFPKSSLIGGARWIKSDLWTQLIEERSPPLVGGSR